MWMSHATHMNESCHTYERVTPHIWMSHVTHMNESCHTYEWVMSHIWMSRVTHMNESCHTYECVMAHIWMTHSKHMNGSCHAYECVVCAGIPKNQCTHDTYDWVVSPYTWMSHVTHMNESCHTYEWVTPHTWTGVHVCDMTHSCVWSESFIYVTWRIHMCDMTHSHGQVMSHIWMCHRCRNADKPDTVFKGSSAKEKHSFVRELRNIGSFESCDCWFQMCHGGRNAEKPVHTRHIWMSRVSICMNESCHTYEWVMSHIWMSHATHTDRWRHTYECVMGAGMPENQCTHDAYWSRKLCKRETSACTRVE